MASARRVERCREHEREGKSARGKESRGGGWLIQPSSEHPLYSSSTENSRVASPELLSISTFQSVTPATPQRHPQPATHQRARALEARVPRTKKCEFRVRNIPVSKEVYVSLMVALTGGKDRSPARSGCALGGECTATIRHELSSFRRVCVFRGALCRRSGDTAGYGAWETRSGQGPGAK